MKQIFIDELARSGGSFVENPKDTLVGRFSGYYVIIRKIGGKLFDIQINANRGGVNMRVIQNFLFADLGLDRSVSKCSYENSTITYTLKGKGDYQKQIIDTLNKCTIFCRQYGLTTGCAFCGEAGNHSTYRVKGIVRTICPGCYEQYFESVFGKKRKQNKRDKNCIDLSRNLATGKSAAATVGASAMAPITPMSAGLTAMNSKSASMDKKLAKEAAKDAAKASKLAAKVAAKTAKTASKAAVASAAGTGISAISTGAGAVTTAMESAPTFLSPVGKGNTAAIPTGPVLKPLPPNIASKKKKKNAPPSLPPMQSVQQQPKKMSSSEAQLLSALNELSNKQKQGMPQLSQSPTGMPAMTSIQTVQNLTPMQGMSQMPTMQTMTATMPATQTMATATMSTMSSQLPIPTKTTVTPMATTGTIPTSLPKTSQPPKIPKDDKVHLMPFGLVTESNTDSKKKKKNAFTGLLGAFTGSLLGVFIWVLAYELQTKVKGFEAVLEFAAVIMPMCSLVAYYKFCGEVKKSGIVATCMITIIMLFAAFNLTVALNISEIFAKEGSNVGIIVAAKHIPKLLKGGAVNRNAYIKSLLGSYVLATLVGGITIFVLNKREKSE